MEYPLPYTSLWDMLSQFLLLFLRLTMTKPLGFKYLQTPVMKANN